MATESKSPPSKRVTAPPRQPPPRNPRAAGMEARPPLVQFVVLSLLLHALFIALFGAPAGGSPEGRAMWGSLDVVLTRDLPGISPRTDPDDGARLPLPGNEMVKQLERRRAARSAPVIAPEPSTATPLPPATRAPQPIVPLPTPDLAALQETDRPVTFEPLRELPRTVAPVIAPSALESIVLPRFKEELVRPLPIPALVAPLVTTPIPESIAPPAPATATPPRELPASPSDSPSRERADPRPAERTSPAGREQAPRVPAGLPSERTSDVFRKRDDPATPPADTGTAPRIDLEAARKRAREMGREGSGQRALLPFLMPPAEEKKSKEALALEKALKPECKDAYKGLGLLAVVPLVANEFGEGNCRW